VEKTLTALRVQHNGNEYLTSLRGITGSKARKTIRAVLRDGCTMKASGSTVQFVERRGGGGGSGAVL
jgi:hypothetical protein